MAEIQASTWLNASPEQVWLAKTDPVVDWFVRRTAGRAIRGFEAQLKRLVEGRTR